MELKESHFQPSTRQYDTKVEGYKKQTERPLRKFTYEYTLLKNIGDLRGKRVLDIACGEGLSSRLARDLGAKEVVGIDEAHGQIKKAEEQETAIPENERIKYIVADGGNIPLKTAEKFDAITGIMFLNYTESRERLDQIAGEIKEHLKEDGTFYALLPNPDLHADCDKYGVKMKTETPEEGSLVNVEISDFEGNLINQFTNHYWKRETYQSALEKQGFDVEWIDSDVSPQGIEEYGEEFWEDYKKSPIYVLLRARNSKIAQQENLDPREEKMIDDIMEYVGALAGKDERDFSKEETEAYVRYADNLAVSALTSRKAGLVFKNLIPRSMRTPDFGYDAEKLDMPIINTKKRIREITATLGKSKAYEKLENDFLSNVYMSEPDKDYPGTIKMIEARYCRAKRDDGQTMIEELTENAILEEGNIPHSTLIVIDHKSGTHIDLDELLPSRCVFVPEGMLKIEDVFDPDQQKFIRRFGNKSLHEYLGAGRLEEDEVESENYHFSDIGYVAFNDLRKSGSILALFHELAHSWQSIYYKNPEEIGFDNFYMSATSLLAVYAATDLQCSPGYWDKRAKSPQESELLTKICLERRADFLDQLNKMGVELDPDDYIFDKGYKPEHKGKTYISHPLALGHPYFIVKCDKFMELARRHYRDEKDAWAHGLLMLRYLRKQGIDLEPGLNSYEKIKSYMYPCLETHRKYLLTRFQPAETFKPKDSKDD